jgi:hypothetical protein
MSTNKKGAEAPKGTTVNPNSNYTPAEGYTPWTVTVVTAKYRFNKEKGKSEKTYKTKAFGLVDGKAMKVPLARPFLHTVRLEQAKGIRGYHEVRSKYEFDPTTAFIIGAYVGKEQATIAPGGGVQLTAGGGGDKGNPTNFVEREVAFATFDIDAFKPFDADPVTEPVEAILEYVARVLPGAFHGKSFDWALSSSAGMVYWDAKKETGELFEVDNSKTLKAHVTFELETPYLNSVLDAWAKRTSPLIDSTVFRTVQPHYIACPIFRGFPDPIPEGKRSGFYTGPAGDSVLLVIDDAVVEGVKNKTAKQGNDKLPDMKAKPGVIGAFCRAFSNEDVISDGDLLGDEFDLSSDDPDHYFWSDANAEGGVYLRGDSHIGCSNNTWLEYFDSPLQNIWDVLRVLKFGHLDKVADEFEQLNINNLPIQAKPSSLAMTNFARSLPEVQLELTEEKKSSIGGSILRNIAKRLDREDLDEFAKEIGLDVETIDAAYGSLAWDASKSKFCLLSPLGVCVLSSEKDLPAMVEEHYSPLIDRAGLHDAIVKFADDNSWDIARADKKRAAELFKELLAKPMAYITRKGKAHRQVSKFEIFVDMFGTVGGMRLRDGIATMVFPHRPFAVGDIDFDIVGDYKKHFPEFDPFISLLAASRFASSRKKSHLWLNCESDWGKSFLMSALSKLNLVVETSVSELAKMMEGGPVGKTLDEFKPVWVLAIDEFKGVTREVKQLSEYINFAPKGLATVQAPLYLKLFMSAEKVDSLASDDTGIEDQFANRFMLVRGQGNLEHRPKFMQSKAGYLSSLVSYVGSSLNRYVREYQAMGSLAASDAADAQIVKLYEKFRIDRAYKRLSTMFDEMAQRFAEEVAAAYKAQESYGFNKCTRFQREAAGYVVDTPTQGLCLTKPATVLERWMVESFTKSELGKIGFKKLDILLGSVDNQSAY